LRSSGRYGPSPFLVGHYGGSGEIAQGFCRTAAVQGAVYILGRKVVSITPQEKDKDDPRQGDFEVEVDDIPEKLTCDLILSAADLVLPSLSSLAKSIPVPDLPPIPSLARGIAILDQPIYFDAPQVEIANEPPADVRVEGEETSNLDARGPIDTAMLVFPPSSVPGGSTSVAVTALVTGEASMSTPTGKCT
jgi:Rab proteins geranylgeranyltransferase component A